MLDKKKERFFIGLTLFLIVVLPLILNLILVKAQEVPQIPGVPISIQNPEKLAEQAKTKANETSNYLKKEWKEILGKSRFAPFINFADKILTFLNPFFKLVLGVEYSLSWAFIFAIAIWIILFLFIFPVSSQLFNKKLFGLIASFIIVSLVGLSGVIKRAVDLLSLMINNTWIFWVSLVITFLIAVFIVKLGGGLKKIIEKEQEKAAKQKEKQDRDILKTGAESVKETFEHGAGI